MPKALVIYHSRSGNTEKMAKKFETVLTGEGIDTVLKKASEVSADELIAYDGIIIGSPTYYGTMAWEIKKLIDESVRLHGRLKGKVGAAFSSSANTGGGNETTVTDIINAMLVHGMIVQGEPSGDHYGPVSVGAPDARAFKCCERTAKNAAALLKKLAG